MSSDSRRRPATARNGSTKPSLNRAGSQARTPRPNNMAPMKQFRPLTAPGQRNSAFSNRVHDHMVGGVTPTHPRPLTAIEILLESDLTAEAIQKEKLRDMLTEASTIVGMTNLRLDMESTISEYKKLLRAEAEKGCPISSSELGFMYARGKYLTKDMGEAAFWFQRAADGGHPESQYQLSRCYIQGKGKDVDNNQAMKWAHKASDAGHADAQYMLATGYAAGMGLPHDPYKAFELYKNAAVKGHEEAAFVCAIVNSSMGNDAEGEKGDGTWRVAGTSKKALQFRAKSLARNEQEQNSPSHAMEKDRRLSFTAQINSEGKAVDRETLAAYNVAEQLFNGESVARNYGKAALMFEAAAEAGFVPAVYKLGLCYEKGYGKEVNAILAVELYEKAHAGGDID
eukprot:CAMPEP_0182890174 /NCGR_PEP_ID=MMETSP0034_2-20130328/22490_1 /TAXON_ID=156128 /ORGANISM="Nephroselmis pyriformis, Strain CCMP717" /LENGTH=397 /DNA_ID=CAMNT_0025023707 /DNA_START=348 /DNA_END=1538 /DNA_ORIENTATION=+